MKICCLSRNPKFSQKKDKENFIYGEYSLKIPRNATKLSSVFVIVLPLLPLKMEFISLAGKTFSWKIAQKFTTQVRIKKKRKKDQLFCYWIQVDLKI